VRDVERYQLDMVGLTSMHSTSFGSPGEGLDSLLFWSCPGCEAPDGCGDTHKSPAGHHFDEIGGRL